MNFKKRMIIHFASKVLRSKGYNQYIAWGVSREFANELLENPDNISFKQRVWAWKRGFFAERIKMYNLTDENYTDFLTDADYFKMYPLNDKYERLIDDKLTLRYTLSEYKEFLPAYYFSMRETGEPVRMMDCPETITGSSFSDIITLLREVGTIAAKPNFGSVGEGFYKLEYKDKTYIANGKTLDETQLLSLLHSLKNYIFTEFVQQADIFEDIYPGVAHTLRVQTARMPDGEIKCIFSFLRIGSKSQVGCVTHSTSGVTASVNADTGMISHPYYVDSKKQYVFTKTHPDTGASVYFKIPRWNKIIDKLIEIHQYIGELDYLGFDIITTNDSFKICEINSHSSIRSAQHGYPFLKDEKCRQFFMPKLSEIRNKP